jgi:hypothetical protein
MNKATMRLAATAGLLMVVAAGVSPAVLAQAEEPFDPMGAAYWTGTWTANVDDAEYVGVETQHDGYKEISGLLYPGEIAADDPRMVGTWRQEEHLYVAENQEPGEGDGVVGISAGTARIDNDAGAWVGTYTHFRGTSGAGCPPICIGGGEWYVMHGEGAYEGLTTVMRYSHDDEFQGVIMPSDDLPALPDPFPPPCAGETHVDPSCPPVADPQ